MVCVWVGGGEFLRTLTPSDPAQPKKSGESDCRLQTCRLADGVEGKLAVRQTAEAEKSKSDSGGEMEEKAHKEANRD